jgi:hypothetical protein
VTPLASASTIELSSLTEIDAGVPAGTMKKLTATKAARFTIIEGIEYWAVPGIEKLFPVRVADYKLQYSDMLDIWDAEREQQATDPDVLKLARYLNETLTGIPS